MAEDKVVSVDGLVKVYPGGTRAVAGISFAVDRGEFVGFLGPNGAGKSTTLKILATLLKKTAGTVAVLSHDVDHDPMAIRRGIGFAMQEVGLDDLSPGREFLETQGLLYGLSAREAKGRAAELLDLVGLSSVARRKIATYSGGMRRRLDLVAALMHRPSLLFLDEPTTGLDPQSRRAIWDYLEHLNRDGVTVFLTTQIMEEADHLCQRIAIIDRGQLVAEGSPKALKQGVGGDVITIHLDSPNRESEAELAGRAESLAKTRPYVLATSVSGSALIITARDGGAAVPDLLQLFHADNLSVLNLSVATPTLDDAFLRHTGRTIRADAADGAELDQGWRQYMGLGRR